MTNLIGKRIEHYRVEALLGEGGMGVVYRAVDLNLERSIALKVMHDQYARQPEFQERFLQGARSAARLEHPSIITIHSFGNRSDMLYIDMKLVRGGTLAAYFKQLEQEDEMIRLRESLHIIGQVAEALGYAHHKGVIHRDIKPGNILIRRLAKPERIDEPPLRAIVVDFGLAKLLDGGIHTATGAMMGTFPYMSPEQLEGRNIDGRSDIYSLGIVLYQLATGKLPFDIRSLADAVIKHRTTPPPDPNSIQPGLPHDITAIILTALAKDPAERFQSGAAMARALRESATRLTVETQTMFITASNKQVVSLLTKLDFQEPISNESAAEPFLEPNSSVTINYGNIVPETHSLPKPIITIGRTAENDIMIPLNGVSKAHARLEHTDRGWMVTDLNSTNGTYLGKSKLLADKPELWQPGTQLKISDSWLTLETEQSAISRPNRTMIHSSPFEGREETILLQLTQFEFVVQPGNAIAIPFNVFNQGNIVEHVRIILEGVPQGWLSSTIPVLHLMDGAEQSANMLISVPYSSASKAGSYPLTLYVQNQAGQQKAAVQAVLTVNPFYDFQITLQPQQQRSVRGAFQVNIKNLSNTDLTFALTGQNPRDACDFQFNPPELSVAAAGQASAEMAILARDNIVAIGTDVFPFTVTAVAKEANMLPKQLHGIWEYDLPTFALDIKESAVRDKNRGQFDIVVSNTSHTPLTILLTCKDIAGANAIVTPAMLTVAPGQDATAQLSIRPVNLNSSQTFEFRVLAKASNATAVQQQVAGSWQYIATPPPKKQSPAPKPRATRPKPVVEKKKPGCLPLLIKTLFWMVVWIAIGGAVAFFMWENRILDLLAWAVVSGMGCFIVLARAIGKRRS